jgi:hypothetical protein
MSLFSDFSTFKNRNQPLTLNSEIPPVTAVAKPDACARIFARNHTVKKKMNTKADCINSIFGSLTRTSRWRAGLQKKYPSDARNGRAAETLSRLAKESCNLSDKQWAELQPHFHWSSERWADALAQTSRFVEFQRYIKTFPAFEAASPNSPTRSCSMK